MAVLHRQIYSMIAVAMLRVAFRCTVLIVPGGVAFGADIDASRIDRTGRIAWSNAFPAGVATVESVGALTGISSGQWSIGRNYFTSNSTWTVAVPLSSVEGALAVQTPLALPRSVWFLANNGFFISEHDAGGGLGNRIWYVDPAGIIHRWVNGNSADNKRVGDGQWFYANPSLGKVSRVRAVNTDPFGNLIITESNFGYVRRIRFQRLTP